MSLEETTVWDRPERNENSIFKAVDGKQINTYNGIIRIIIKRIEVIIIIIIIIMAKIIIIIIIISPV